MTVFELLERMTSKDYHEQTTSKQRIEDSIMLARLVGVPEEDILKSDEEAESFFMS